ncbi:helix-turn-helix domain-containing protein [Streptomyces sp. NPDC004629]|uniref:helix-turn-helix domain-containing protein n=1 Tax=Streptomyces sp. NPDC004629 TaxID=3364705 RepID=UPI0036BC8931
MLPDRSAPAAPAVPPTPPVPLAALLAREDLALRQIAGPSGPGVAIHWAHTSEMSDPYPYLLGGELLLTAGVHIPEAAGSDGGAPGRAKPSLGKYFDDYVARIVAAGGAALGFGVAPVHDTVPRALVAACEAYELPLVEVPPQTTFSGVARAVWQLMAQARLAELRRVTEAQQSLASAASRPDPVPAVLRRLAQRLGGRACLYGPDGTEIASAGRPPEDDVRTALNRLTQVVRPLPNTPRNPAPSPCTPEPPGPPPSSRTPEPPGPAPAPTTADAGRRAPTKETASAPPPTQATAPVHACTGDHTPPPLTASGPTARPATGPATPARAAHPSHTHSADHASTPGTATSPTTPTPTPAPGPITRPATGPATPAQATAPVHARSGDGSCTSGVVSVPAGGRVGPASAADAVGGTHLAAYSLGNGQGFVLGVVVPRREAGDHTIASVAAVLLSLLTGEHQSGAGAARSAALVRLLLGAEPEDVAPLLGDGRWRVVHARPQTQAPDTVAGSALGAALGSALVDVGRDAVRVLVPADREPDPQPGWTLGVSAPVAPHEWPSADAQAARALTRARVTGTALVRHGGRAGLTGLVPADEAEGFARELLAPLAGRPALAETLRSWLSLHGSWDRTAVALAVHRNTVRQRIGRCAALLGADLDDPDVRMELWFALKHGE